VAHAEQLAPAIIDLVEMAANGVCLPKQENLLFWGIHVLGRRIAPRFTVAPASDRSTGTSISTTLRRR
jgi:hypothetical protein